MHNRKKNLIRFLPSAFLCPEKKIIELNKAAKSGLGYSKLYTRRSFY